MSSQYTAREVFPSVLIWADDDDGYDIATFDGIA